MFRANASLPSCGVVRLAELLGDAIRGQSGTVVVPFAVTVHFAHYRFTARSLARLVRFRWNRASVEFSSFLESSVAIPIPKSFVPCACT